MAHLEVKTMKINLFKLANEAFQKSPNKFDPEAYREYLTYYVAAKGEIKESIGELMEAWMVNLASEEDIWKMIEIDREFGLR